MLPASESRLLLPIYLSIYAAFGMVMLCTHHKRDQATGSGKCCRVLLRREEGRRRIAGCEEPSHIYNVYIYIQTDELPTPIFFHLISLRDRIRELLILRILPLHPVGDIRRNALFQIRHTLHRLAPNGEVRHDARPHPLPHARVGEIPVVLPRGAGPDLGARAPDRDA